MRIFSGLDVASLRVGQQVGQVQTRGPGTFQKHGTRQERPALRQRKESEGHDGRGGGRGDRPRLFPFPAARQEHRRRPHQEHPFVACHREDARRHGQRRARGRRPPVVRIRQRAAGQVEEHQTDQGMEAMLHADDHQQGQRGKRHDRQQGGQRQPGRRPGPAQDRSGVPEQAQGCEPIEHQGGVGVDAREQKAGGEHQRPRQRADARVEPVGRAVGPDAVPDEVFRHGEMAVGVINRVLPMLIVPGEHPAHEISHRCQQQPARS